PTGPHPATAVCAHLVISPGVDTPADFAAASRRDSRLAAVAVILLLAGVTLLAGIPSGGPDRFAWPAGVRQIAVLLTVPIRQESAFGILRAIFFFIVGICLGVDGMAHSPSGAAVGLGEY